MKERLLKVSLCLALSFGMVSTAALAAQGGSIGQGDFSVMEGDRLVDKLSGLNPLKDESMLVCDGKCMVKSEGISLVAGDQAKFAIKNESDTFRLFLREGSVDYVITDKARKIAFHTPEGVYSVADIIFNAASNPVVRGTVMVNADGKTEISVKEGRMTFATADGMKTVGANEKIVLAIADVGAVGAGTGTGTGFSAGTGLIAAGIVGGAMAVGAYTEEHNKTSTPTPSPSM
ncbi:MAG TPA: hypothetical protein DCY35_04560 [Prolixibacteraceae bacterium]|jgi:hypothetical protein|nr:hypothetical protein [Prolixibacteraceae bacterium]